MVKRVVNFVYREVRGLHQAAYVIALFTVGSQFLAIVRDRLLAHTFGAGSELDLYYAAFRIPDLLYVLFASVLSVYVLLPFVNKYNDDESKKQKINVLSQVFTIFLFTYALIAVVLAVAAPLYVDKFFPGLTSEKDTLVLLLRVLLLQPFLLGLSSLCGVVTQMNNRFVLYAISPLLYNIGIIIGIALFYPQLGLLGLALGVVLGALGHLLIQLPFVIGERNSFFLVKDINWPLMREILSVSVPRALTLSVNQLVLLVLMGMATVMTAGSVSVFQFAFNLQSVPLAIIGMSYSVAAFPTLSYLFSNHDHKGFSKQLITALRHIIFWSVPVVALVVVLRAHIVRVLLGSGEFDWGDTRLTAAVLAIFVISLIAQAILLLLIRAFYAGGRTVLPFFVAILGAVVSIGSALVLQKYYFEQSSLNLYLDGLFRLRGVEGAEILVLAVGFVIGQFVQMFVLMYLSSKTFEVSYRPLFKLFTQSLIASVVGGFTAYGTLVFVVDGVNQETLVGILLQGLSAGIVGVISIIFTYVAFGSREVKEVYKSFQTKILKTDVVAPQ